MIDLVVIERTRELILWKYPFIPPLALDRVAVRDEALSGRDLETMVHLYAKPFLGVEDRAAQLNMSSQIVRRTIKRCVAKDFLREGHFSCKPRGFNVFCDFTPDGLRSARLDLPAEGSGGILHRRAQMLLRDYYVREGYDAVIEKNLNGKRADIGFLKDDKWVGVECGFCNAVREIENIHDDFGAGYNEVLVLCRDSKMLDAIQISLKEKPANGVLHLELFTDYLRLAREKKGMSNE